LARVGAAPLVGAAVDDGGVRRPQVIRWIEANCKQGEGDSFGKPVKLEMFQKIFLCWLFEKRPDGRYRYRRAYLQTPKNSGKTSLAAWISAYQLAHQFSPVIPIVASSYDQAELVFGDLRTTVTESPTLSQVMVPFEGEVQLKDGPGRAFKVPAVSGVNDGMRPSTAVFDEVHEFCTPNQTRTHLVIGNGCAKRAGSLQVNTSTPAWDTESLAGKLHTRGLAVNSGEVDDDEFLFCWWGCPADRYDLSTPDGLRAAIRAANPAADLFVDVESVAAKYSELPLAEFERYFLARWTTTAQAWLPPGAWGDCADPSVIIPDGAEVCIGFDGSVSNDSTAIVAVSCTERPHISVVNVWEKPEGAAGEGWRVPVETVEQAIRDACRRWKVREVVADSFRWEASLQRLESDGLPVVRFPQSTARMTPASQRFYSAVVDQTVTHDGNPALARHVGNAVLRVNSRGQRIEKETRYSAKKVDLCVAAVMALDRAAEPDPNDYDILQSVV